MLDPIGLSPPVSSVFAADASRGSEKAGRIPDNEAAELKPKAPLAPYQGTVIDVEA